jgi:hypothetical protein
MRQLEFNFGAMALYYNYTEIHPKVQDFHLRSHGKTYASTTASSSGLTGSTSTSPCAATTRLWPHALYADLAVRRDYSSPAARALRPPRHAPRLLVSGRTRSTSTSSSTASTRLHSPGCSDLPRLRRASECLGMSRGSSRGSSSTTLPRAGSSSTTPPRAGSSSTTSPTLRVRVPRHVARLVTRLVAPLVVDYSASRRLFVDYSASRRLIVNYSTTHQGASARRATRRRLLRLRHTSGCLGTSRGSSRG